MLIGVYVARVVTSRVQVGVYGAHASPAPQYLVRGDPTVGKLEAIVTIEALVSAQ